MSIPTFVLSRDSVAVAAISLGARPKLALPANVNIKLTLGQAQKIISVWGAEKEYELRSNLSQTTPRGVTLSAAPKVAAKKARKPRAARQQKAPEAATESARILSLPAPSKNARRRAARRAS